MAATEFGLLGELEELETPRVRPRIRTICGEARRIRSQLLTPQIGVRGPTIVHARKWLSRTSKRWPYESLRELTRHELDILAGCLWRIASAMGEETESYRRLRSDIGRLLGVPAGDEDKRDSGATEFELLGELEEELLEDELEEEALEIEPFFPLPAPPVDKSPVSGCITPGRPRRRDRQVTDDECSSAVI
jgi:hypothetical protein